MGVWGRELGPLVPPPPSSTRSAGPPHHRPPLNAAEDDGRGGARAVERDVLGERVERRIRAIGQLALQDELVAAGLVARPRGDALFVGRRALQDHELPVDLLRLAPVPTGFITKFGDGGPPEVLVASIPVVGLGLVNEKPSTGRTSRT